MKTGSKIGAVLAMGLFLFWGLMPAVYFGGYGAISIMGKLFGLPIQSGLLERIGGLLGIFIGIFTMFSMFIVAGALIGSLIGWLFSSKIMLDKKIIN